MPRTPPAATPDRVDIHVGHAVRARRNVLGCSQTELADAIGVTFQQVQKYERAANRVSASMLVRIAAHLRCPASELLPPSDEEAQDLSVGLGVELAALGGGVELAAAFSAMGPRHRRALLGVARALVELDEDKADT